ncbi:CDP-alcohol phosphatidyltransferase family protein [uncultured Maribacter sp.]|uniref:CDP-alcohol phosphatidyltransferase family protein n=1 Tax=uncultured Maribacter sp. TaxID=431308 RepID=UPI0030EC93CB|tara:strand:- start:12751 stop:13518 length:768 start_codon:yes stop_codon:yes gene_type:complete
MSKLPKQNQFFDLSDYGRPIAQFIAHLLKNTTCTPIQVTLSFFVSGLLAIGCILYGEYWAALFFLILKSVLDAADGELARLKNTPSHTGRYFDSVSDFILNLLFILSIWHITNSDIFIALLAFVGLELQGTLYNYYYVILRNKYNGDTTSRVFENKTPTALSGENQQSVDILYRIYSFCYGPYDRIIYGLDKKAIKGKYLPNWLMTAVSTFGLGFQLLLIGIFLVFDLKTYIIPFFISYSLMIFVFILIRQLLNK